MAEAAELYDALGPLYDGEYASDLQDVPFYQGLAARSGGPILEVACGSGRVLEGLADADWAPVVGLDASPVLLERARRRLQARPPTAALLAAGGLRLVHGDMRQFEAPVEGGYALAIIALNAFLHLLEAADQTACLRAVARHLRPGGLLALDVFNPENKGDHPGVDRLELAADFHHPETGERVQRLAQVTTDLAAQRRRYVHLYDTLGADGALRRQVHEFELRYVYRMEMERLLEGAGLALEAVYGGYEYEPYTGREDLMLFVAARPG